jgi:hypothetical protein
MKSKVFCGLGLCASLAVCASSAGGPPLKVVSWGDFEPTWLRVPDGLPELVEIQAGDQFVVGRTTDGTLIGWGYFVYPTQEFFVPSDVSKVRLLTVSQTGVMVVTEDGLIRVWGYGLGQVLYEPPAMDSVVDIAMGSFGALALKASGEVVAWGSGAIVGQMPTDLGPCIAVGASYDSGVAITQSGEIRCWELGGTASCEPPGGLPNAIEVGPFEGGTRSAITDDGTVVTWGSFASQTPPPPADELVDCVLLRGSGLGSRTGVVRADGTAFVWGVLLAGTSVPSPQPGAVRDIAMTGASTFALIDEFTDCNANGLDDSAEIESGTELDCNGDWIPDTCQFAEGTVEDCNGNGIADACEKATPFEATSANLGPIGFGSPQSWAINEPAAASSHATLSLTAKGDFSSVSEYVVVRLNGDAVGVAFVDGADCTEIGPETITISAATFNALVGPDGAATFTFEPTIAVNANSCPGGSWIAASLSYNGATELDCNANGLLDACEIAAGYAEDCDLDGVPDSCQDTTADCDGNRVWDACDIASGAAVDCNGNGIPDACDIGSGSGGDCNGNGRFDECEIADGTTADCDDNGVPDSCEVLSGVAADCNGNGTPDACDISGGGDADCNGNGVPDTCDIVSGAEIDINSNGVPDSCEGLGCPGDLNDDGKVDAADLAVMLGFWGPVGTFPAADIDGSGLVDAGDLAILLGGWGACP